MADLPEVVVVPVKPWYTSKINWTQFFGTAAMVATYLGYTVPVEVVPAAVAAIAAGQALLTVVLRTWFSAEIVDQAAKKLVQPYP